jgi:hypothetical protein
MVMTLVFMPASGALAATTILTGQATVTNSEPITIAFVSGDGVYDNATHSWAVTTVGGGTAHLVLRATNNSTTAYTVNAAVIPVGAPTGITSAWSPTAKYLAAGANQDFTLTVTVAADAPLAANAFTFTFTR